MLLQAPSSTTLGLISGSVTISGASNPSANGVSAIEEYILDIPGPVDLSSDLVPQSCDINVFGARFFGIDPFLAIISLSIREPAPSTDTLEVTSAFFGSANPPLVPGTCQPLIQLRHIAERESSCMEAK